MFLSKPRPRSRPNVQLPRRASAIRGGKDTLSLFFLQSYLERDSKRSFWLHGHLFFHFDFRHFLESIIGSEDNSHPRVWDIPGKSPDLPRVGSPKTACRKPGGKNEGLPTHLPHLFLVFTSRAPGASTVSQHNTARGLHGG